MIEATQSAIVINARRVATERQEVEAMRLAHTDEFYYRADCPAYEDAARFLKAVLLEDYERLGLGPAEAAERLGKAIRAIALTAYREGGNAAEIVLELATARGWNAHLDS